MDWGLIGNPWAVGLLQRQMQRGTLHHAYLMAGMVGSGREALALALAQAFLCEHPPELGRWCGECRACRQVPAGTYPDLHRVIREEGKQGISIEQVRELQRQLALTPLGSKGRVAILPDFDYASEGAANALLKTLEEPVGRVILVLTALEVDAVPATIASRCESLSLRPVAVAELAQALLEGGASAEQARLAAEASDGLPMLARRMLEDPGLLDRRSGHIDALQEVLHQELPGRFALAESWKDKGELEERLGVWTAVLRAALRQGFGSATAQAGLPARVASLSASARRTALGSTLETMEALQRNVNPRLALEKLMLELPEL